MVKKLNDFEYKILLNLISSNNEFLNRLELKYKGLFVGKNLNDNSIEIIEELIDKKVYVIDDSLEIIFSQNELSDFIYNDNYIFGIEGIHKNKMYRLNKDLSKEVYDVVKFIIENKLELFFRDDIHNLISELNSMLDDTEKLEYLKIKLNEYWKPNKDVSIFLLYMEKSIETNYLNWEDYILDCFTCDDTFIKYYLSAKFHQQIEKTIFYDKDYRKWIKFYRLKKLINFCLQSINTIQQKTKNNNENSKSKKIFKNNGLDVFNFIVANYTSLKNNAFFSYLFHYCTDNNFLQGYKANSSTAYNEFLLENKYVENFTRVIARADGKGTTQENMFEIFKNLHQDFIQSNLK